MKFIGVFDSGLGGITVLSDLIKELPNENFIYLGDSSHAPYGEKSKEDIIAYSNRIVEDFVKEGAKAIVVACNTATSAAINVLRENYPIPIIGMEPALKPAIEHGMKGILVLATAYTIKNDKFLKLKERVVSGQTVHSVAASELVNFVENGITDGPEIERYLDGILKGIDADSIVLGCTHFLYLKDTIQKYFQKPIHFFDGNHGTVERVKSLIDPEEHGGYIEIRNSLGQTMVEKSIWMKKRYQEMNIDSIGDK